MAARQPGAVVRGLERIFNQGSLTGLSEGQLLRRFAAGDQGAFETLVERHGPMVLGVCRRSLRHSRDVEDAFQATFLVLLRKAGTLARRRPARALAARGGPSRRRANSIEHRAARGRRAEGRAARGGASRRSSWSEPSCGR